MSRTLLAEAEELIRTMQSMLSDLHDNFGWDELISSLEAVNDEAEDIFGKAASIKNKATVEVCASHFIGKGSMPFLITGRICGDDDDTPLMIMADNQGDAYETFVNALTEEWDDDFNDEEVPEIYVITTTSLNPDESDNPEITQPATE